MINLAVISLLIQPVTLDSATLNELQQDKTFDYYHAEIEEPSIWEQLQHQFWDWLTRHINPNITEEQVNTGCWIVLGILVVLIIWLLYHYKPSFFYINSKRKIGFQVENEDIHQLDFDELIRNAQASGNYAEAIRWKYLQVLKNLHENELISFDANKTVNEYVHELKRPDLKNNFKSLSQRFVYYRYGNGVASEEDFRAFAELSGKIIRRYT